MTLGTLSGATALVLFLDWFEALRDPDPLAHEGFELQVLIAVISAWIFALAIVRVTRLLRHPGMRR
ncbi:MAG TPA: hypothetical protein VGS17_02865 [Candidatus Limnocylindria bacterium]|nr:hypothetical protein [Candidatus Limnocylindria bacterium]